jgi:hypothetical protein
MSNLKAAVKQLQSERAGLERSMKRIDRALLALGSRAGRHRLSVAARNRIAAAQRVRWAKWKAAHKETV